MSRWCHLGERLAPVLTLSRRCYFWYWKSARPERAFMWLLILFPFMSIVEKSTVPTRQWPSPWSDDGERLAIMLLLKNLSEKTSLYAWPVCTVMLQRVVFNDVGGTFFSFHILRLHTEKRWHKAVDEKKFFAWWSTITTHSIAFKWLCKLFACLRGFF